MVRALRGLDRLVRFIQQGVRKWGADGAVVGISGGLNSAVVAALAARALGPARVLGILMPERDSAPPLPGLCPIGLPNTEDKVSGDRYHPTPAPGWGILPCPMGRLARLLPGEGTIFKEEV